MLAHPCLIASYTVPVRRYRILSFGFLQCIPRGKPPCHVLILRSVTSAYKGLAPSGKKTSLAVCFLEEKFAFFIFFLSLGEWCTAARAGHTQAIYKMRVFRLVSKFWSFSQVLYRGTRMHLCKSRTLHIAKRYQQAEETNYRQ